LDDKGLADVDRHVIGCHLPHDTRVRSALDDVATNIRLALITGHSMGGHGALTIAFKNPDAYASVSAFSPICNPSAVGAFTLVHFSAQPEPFLSLKIHPEHPQTQPTACTTPKHALNPLSEPPVDTP